MNLKNKNLPKLIFAIGIIVMVVAYLLTAIVMKPAVTEYDFDYSVTYKLNGETVTVDGVYTCSFIGNGRDGDPRVRYYQGSYPDREDSNYPGSSVIAEKDGLELHVVTVFTADYLMGDGDKFYLNEVYLAVYDDMGVEYTDEETLGKFDAEIVSYELPQPIENSLVFGGFSVLHDLSMAVTYGVGILLLIACIVLVKRDDGVEYKVLDKISVVLNFVIGVLVIPFILTIVYWSQIFETVSSLPYQIELCVPALGMLAIAASLCLRRKGFTKSGFFVQFAGPVLYFLSLIIDIIA